MEEIATALISRALDGLNQRYAFTAQNIANANSPDYRPARVSFEESLRVASSQGLAAIEAVEPRVAYEQPIEGETAVRLDLELATASQTAGRYRTLLDLLGRQMAIHRTLITGGRS
jgi:flagellar basal-body rod protein FlgB